MSACRIQNPEQEHNRDSNLQYFERTNSSLGLEGALGASSSQVAWPPQQVMCTVRSPHQLRSRRSVFGEAPSKNLSFLFKKIYRGGRNQCKASSVSEWAPLPNLQSNINSLCSVHLELRDHLLNPINTIPSTNSDRIQQIQHSDRVDLT
jgi:hypothetical protein